MRVRCLSRGVAVCAAVLGLVAAGLSCDPVGTGEGTTEQQEVPAEEIRALVEQFQEVHRTGDLKGLRRILTGEMARWAEETDPVAWQDTLVDPDNEFTVRSIEGDPQAGVRAMVVFRDPDMGLETELEFGFARRAGRWKIASARRVEGP